MPASLRAAIGKSLGDSAVPAGYSQAGELTGTGTVIGSHFGWSVAVSGLGTTAVVGELAPASSGSIGSAYVFTLGRGGWSQTAKLTGSGAAPDDFFGSSVAISALGTTVVVGAYGQHKAAGAVYVFTRGRGGWSQTGELTGSDTKLGNAFGYSVAVSALGGTVVAGAPHRDRFAGAVYVFTRGRGGWSQAAELTDPGTVPDDQFGWSVAISALGTTAVAGAPAFLGSYIGAAYVFTLGPGGWSRTAKLTGSDSVSIFGSSVAVSGLGTTVVVGAPWYNPDTGFSGAAYVFTLGRGGWSQTANSRRP